jgi:TPR repeat protein
MRRSGLVLWSVAVVGLCVVVAGVAAGVAAGGLPGPGWVTAAIVGATAGIGAFVRALKDPLVKVLGTRIERDSQHAEALGELRMRLGGPSSSRFYRVKEVQERGLMFGVQKAIPLEQGPVDGLSSDLPRYVPRTIDVRLRAALTARSATGGMVVLKGNSTCGKTRSMFEAIGQVVPNWSIVAPGGASQVRGLVTSGIDLARTVIWLDELTDFLGGPERLSLDVIQQAVVKGVILVGTIWKDDFAALTTPSSPASTKDRGADRVSGEASGADESVQARRILMASFVDLVEMPADLDQAEADTAAAVAVQDPRWAQALDHVGDLNPIQALAAAPELLARFHSPDHAVGGAVLKTAVALLAIGHPEPLPTEFLKVISRAALPATLLARLDADWFSDALAWACRPVRGSIAPLTEYAVVEGRVDGYLAQDLLVEVARKGEPAQSLDLALVLEHTSTAASVAIGRFFFARDIAMAEPFVRRAAQEGVSGAQVALARLLNWQGDNEGAEQWFVTASESGDVEAPFFFGLMLSRQAGRRGEAEQWYRKAANASNTDAMFQLGWLLSQKKGREVEAEQWYRKAADGGDAEAPFYLGWLLAQQAGREAEAERWYREAADAGNTKAQFYLGWLLSQKEGRQIEANKWTGKAVDADDTDALVSLGDLLFARKGRKVEAEQWYLKAATAGNTDAMLNLGWLLHDQEGREVEAELWSRKAADAGDVDAMSQLGQILFRQKGREVEVEQWYRKAADAGDIGALNRLGWLLSQQEGRQVEAGLWHRKAVDAGEPFAQFYLASLLSQLEGRQARAEYWYRRAADAGNIDAMFNLGVLLSQQEGQQVQAERYYLSAIDAGDSQALNNLGHLLTHQGRFGEARRALEKGIALGVPHAMGTMGELELLEGHREEAQRWLHRAASLGVSEAADLLRNEFGEDLPQPPEA